MAFQSDTDRFGQPRDPVADPQLDPALRDAAYARARPGSALWIVAGIIVLLGALAVWSGMFDNTSTAPTTATPPAVEAPAPAPQAPQPAPAQ
ncbi:MAG: hypothetical protein AB7S41_07890 [Parvibaculaceae bacterium]